MVTLQDESLLMDLVIDRSFLNFLHFTIMILMEVLVLFVQEIIFFLHYLGIRDHAWLVVVMASFLTLTS